MLAPNMLQSCRSWNARPYVGIRSSASPLSIGADHTGNNMRVLHVYRTYFPDPPGGLQEAIRQISLASGAFGVEPRIFTLSPTPVPREIDSPEGQITRCRSWAAPASCDIGDLGAVSQFRKLTKWADVVHYHFPWPFADLLHFLAGQNKISVMTYHCDIVRQRYLGYIYTPLMRRTLRSMAAVVATSSVYAETSRILTTAVPPERLRTIPLGIVDYQDEALMNGISREFMERWSLLDSPFVLALGVLRYYKGLHTLLEAAPSIQAKVVIAGSGPEEERLKRRALDLGASNVVFTDQVSREEKMALLKHCRVLTLPSHLRAEAFGMVLVEAAMFGKPMVCCEIASGTSFVNVHGETGFVVPPESPTHLAEACNSLLNDDALTNRMGWAARQRYEAFFSGEALGRSYSDLYREVTR